MWSGGPCFGVVDADLMLIAFLFWQLNNLINYLLKYKEYKFPLPLICSSFYAPTYDHCRAGIPAVDKESTSSWTRA